MPEELILTYDIGTSSLKTSIIKLCGDIFDTQIQEYSTRYLPGGIAEQNPIDWWDAACRSTNEIMMRHPQAKSQIAGIGVCGHMLGCIPVSDELEPLYSCIIHSDSRAIDQCKLIGREIGSSYLYEMSGNILDPRSSLSKMLWIKEMLPDVYSKTSKFLQSKDYIVARLTGNLDTTDYSDACHGELMNISTLRYEPSIFQQLGLSLDKLPELHRSFDIVGKVTKESADLLGICSGIPVIAGAGDAACGSAGCGNVNAGDAYMCLGSTAWIAQVSNKPIIDTDRRVFNVMNCDGETSSVYGTMQSACSSVNWIKELINVPDYDKLDELVDGIHPGCDGLVFLPYLDGERSPVFDASARGVFAGLSKRHQQGHIVRAVYEGVAFALLDITNTLRLFDNLTQVCAVGGGIKSDSWIRIISDITGLNVQVLPMSSETVTSLGVASITGLALGFYPNYQQAVKRKHYYKEICPSLDEGRYESNYSAYKGLYPALKNILHSLGESS